MNDVYLVEPLICGHESYFGMQIGSEESFFSTSLIKIQVPKEFTSKNKFKNAFALFV